MPSMLFRLGAASLQRSTAISNVKAPPWRCSRLAFRRVVNEHRSSVAINAIRSSSSSSSTSIARGDHHDADPPNSPRILPVMQEEVLKLWLPNDERRTRNDDENPIRLIDGTIGLGGHALAALNSVRSGGGNGGNGLSILGIDRDATALEKAKKLIDKHFADPDDEDTTAASEEEGDDAEEAEGTTATATLSAENSPFRFEFHHGSFAEISPELLEEYAPLFGPPSTTCAHGILLDCGGPNSLALASPDRGHSFLKQGPLDMRYDVVTPDKANDAVRVRNIVNHSSISELKEIFRMHAPDEPYAGDIAAAIVEWRFSEKVKAKHAKRGAKGIRSTLELRYIVEEAVEEVTPKEENNWKQKAKFRQIKALWRPPKKPATMKRKHRLIKKYEERKVRYRRHVERVFRALRMEANGDVEHVGMAFRNKIAERCLEKGGRLVVIAYHPVEDMLVRRGMEDLVASGDFRLLTPEEEGSRPSEEEMKANERSIGARLRAVERVK